MGFGKKMYLWVRERATAPSAPWWFSIPFLCETFLFVPLDPLLAFFCLQDKRRRWHYATIATMASVIGGSAAYLVGAVMWERIGGHLVHLLLSEGMFNRMVATYTSYHTYAVLVGGLLPLPFKLITLSAGFCKIPFIPFVLSATLARATRFFLVTAAVARWGDRLMRIIDRHTHHLIALIGIKITMLVFAAWWLKGF